MIGGRETGKGGRHRAREGAERRLGGRRGRAERPYDKAEGNTLCPSFSQFFSKHTPVEV